ncbi:MAG: hypothetical protein ACJAYU_003534 [Bradymonadia bacterium]|jgi:hypothetical protein
MYEVRSLCGFLFDELIPLEAKRWLRDGAGFLTLSLPPELLGLPWELLHTGKSYLGLSWAMGRVVQLDCDAEPSRSIIGRSKRVLVIADPDGELHESYDEGMTLRARFGQDEKSRVTFRGGDVDAALLRRQAKSHDIIHYAGHIDADGWRMAESKFGREAVERLSGGAPLPALIFANGCGGAEAADFSGSMLEAWLAGGVSHVVGPLFDLPDRLGRLFAEEFYQHLLSGTSIGEAARLARCELDRTVGEGATPWAAYVLYGPPEDAYFPIAPRAEESDAPEITRPTRLRSRPSPEAVRRTAIVVRDDRPGHTTIDVVFVAVLVAMALAVTAATYASQSAVLADWGETHWSGAE